MLPHWSQNDIMVKGARVHYYRAGQVGQPPLVLVHGFSDNGLCWSALARELEQQFEIFMPDAHGHGLSQRAEPGEQTDMTAELAGTVQGLGLAEAIVGGHSMGAVVAAQLGARYPQLVRALILEDPAWFEPKPEDSGPGLISEESPFKKWIMEAQSQPAEQVEAQCKMEHPAWSDLTIHTWCLGKQQLDVNFFATQDNAWGSWKEVVRAIRCPVLLVTADVQKGGLITPELARWACEANPNFRTVHIAGAGHHVRFEQEAAYMDAVRAFLNDIAA
jgi:N-formylmaleamate deformylase